jgi:hypothetical protein
MKTTLTLLMLGLLLTACRRDDASSTSQIIGAWPSSGANWTNTTTYNSDGTFSIVKQKPGESQSSAGTWKISDGFLTMTFTSSSITNHNSPVGVTERYHIIHLDSHELQMEDVVPIVQTIKR